MTVYGFVGLSGTFYPVAADPITANAWLEDQRIHARLEFRDVACGVACDTVLF